ncbi:MAG: glycosyltransferase family 2 protein [Thermoplasmata archaeon]|nr:glycosyltransferase family 2 protein [Thermoplasmata archaeon]
MAEPTVSVILIAHERTQYILEAASSASASAGEEPGVERLVVKKFRDATIDSALTSSGWKLLQTELDPLGAKVSLGIREASGEVVTFLEDDDAYETSRLAAVRRAFAEDPSLGYYRNGQRFVTADGLGGATPEGLAARNLARIGPVHAAPGQLDSVLSKLCRIDPDFNLSSMALRRQPLLGALPILEGLPAAIDSGLFYASLRAGGGVLIDPTPLTRYRVHGQNTSLLTRPGAPGALEEFLGYHQRFLDSFEPTFRATLKEGPEAARRLAGSSYFGSRVLHDVLTPGARRRLLARDLRSFWHWSPLAHLRYRKDLSAYGLLGVIAPSSARRAYLRRRGLPNP